jgi:Domain of unknown function (DUF5615)
MKPLKLLLDEHISPDVATGLRRRHPALAVYALTEWDDGSLLGQNDFTCLTRAAAEGMALVTYDRRTIPVLLKTWAEQGRSHGGVIFVDEKTISPANVGGLVRAPSQMYRETRKWDWTDRVVFLRR